MKALQFTAPYPGFYQALMLDTGGYAFTARVVPNWAIQASLRVKVDGGAFDQIGQALSQLNLAPEGSQAEPREGQLHTAFVFYNGTSYERRDFNGPLPAHVQEILDRLNAELDAGAKRQQEEFLRHHELMRQLYGDWQDRIGVAVINGSRTRGFKGARALLVTITGLRKQTPTSSPAAASIYHALIFYPEGRLTSMGGGSWGDDPLSSEVIGWEAATGSGGAKPESKALEIKYQAIDGTVGVGGETYRLAEGNMFVIRLGDDWTPSARQLSERIEEPTTDQSVLDRFKHALRADEDVQRLELN